MSKTHFSIYYDYVALGAVQTVLYIENATAPVAFNTFHTHVQYIRVYQVQQITHKLGLPGYSLYGIMQSGHVHVASMSRGIETAPWVVSWRRAMYRLCIAYAIVLFIHSGICDYGSIERPWGLFLSTSCSAVSHLHFGHPDSVQKQYIARVQLHFRCTIRSGQPHSGAAC